jgi:hypothetical protein
MSSPKKSRAGKSQAKSTMLVDPQVVRIHLITHIFNFLTTVAVCAAVVFVAFFMMRMIQSLSGQTTFADIGIKVLGNISISATLAWGVGGTGIIYGWRQRSLRKTTISRLQGRIQYLEQLRDPSRSSSFLTPRGDTNPQDKP